MDCITFLLCTVYLLIFGNLVATTYVFFFFPLLLSALGLGHGQDLILHLTIGRRNIQGATRTVVSSGATSVASGGHTTSEAEGGATSNVDATSVAVGVEAITITITSVPTGKITSRTLKKSNDNNSSSKTIHKDDLTTSRDAQEALRVVTLTTLTDPPHHYRDTRSILLLPHTHLLPNAGKPCCQLTKTTKM